MSRIVDRVGISEGFSGCIRFLQINERPYDMRKGAFIGDAIGGLDIGSFKTFSSSSGHYLQHSLNQFLVPCLYYGHFLHAFLP